MEDPPVNNGLVASSLDQEQLLDRDSGIDKLLKAWSLDNNRYRIAPDGATVRRKAQ